ncbi:microtubule associated protein-domain-containing protein [Geopyxis carbonaria]|nr:microtubule associated protein-domain-containing protein [Geopyxis carbonaria]
MVLAKQQSSLQNELTSVIDKLHGIFDEIGFEQHERQDREDNVYAALNATLHEALCDVSREKNKLMEECLDIISEIKRMEKQLGDSKIEEDDCHFDVSAPLLDCLRTLKERERDILRRYNERLDQVKKMVHAVERYAQHMEASLVQIPLPPRDNDPAAGKDFDISHTYLERLEREFERIYAEYTRRVGTVGSLAKEAINLYGELGSAPEQVDRQILEYGATDPVKLGIAKEDIERLRSTRQRLINEKEKRISRAEEYKQQITEIWEKLGGESRELKIFMAKHRGCDLACMRALEAELDRLLIMKRENLGHFVEDCRATLVDLWNQLHFGEDEKEEFAAAYTDVYTESLLQAHEMEINRLQALLKERGPILNLINRHKELVNEKEQLAISTTDPSRLLGRGGPGGRDPTRLLREEKMRKRISKELPRVEVELKKALEKWEDDYETPMLVNGESYLDVLMQLSPVCASRATTNKPVANNTRGRSNTVGATTQHRAKSRSNVAEKPPVRSKTPTTRPKTPNNGQLSNYQSSTVGRSGGRGLTSAQSFSSTSSFVTTNSSISSNSTGASIDRTGSKTPGLIGRSIPHPLLSSKTPTRIGRPPLSTFPGGMNSPQRQEPHSTSTIGRNASIKRKGGPVGPAGTAPKMQQLYPATENKSTAFPAPYSRQPDSYEEDARGVREGSAGIRSIRSVSPAESSNYEVYPQEEDMRATPKASTHRHIETGYSEYESSAARFQRNREDTPHDGRKYSTSTISTVSQCGSSENWETYGEETDSEVDPRESYYHNRAQTGYTGYGNSKSIGLVQEEHIGDEQMSEVGY